MHFIQGFLGIFVLVGIAWCLSEDRRRVPWKLAGIGFLGQFLIAFLLLRIPVLRSFFSLANKLVEVLMESTRAGTTSLFGYLGGGEPPFAVTNPGNGFILALQSLPLVLLVSALSALFFHWGIIQRIVRLFSLLLKKTMGIGGAEAVGVSANIFVGMVEAPLLVRRYVGGMSRSGLFLVMTTGMATVAGTVLALYANFLQKVLENAAGHLLVASVISAPAAVVFARIMIPEDSRDVVAEVALPSPYSSSMDAVVQGTSAGLKLLLNIVAMMIVLLGLVHLINVGIGFLPEVGGASLSLERLMGWVLCPLAWLLGIPWSESMLGGDLLGQRLVLNELLAYLKLGMLPEGSLSPRSVVILTYALCGFANPGSVGIMIGGLSAMAPERSAEIAILGFRSMLAGFLACCMTGIVAGWLV